jgi:hypothetical protein
MRALFVLTPAESKRLIAQAVAAMEEIKKAKKNGKILIGHGSTNVFVAEEILGKEQFAEFIDGNKYLSGLVIRGFLCTTVGEEKGPILILNRGVVEPPAPTMGEMLLDFGCDAVFIKGANAIDPEGNAGVFVAHPEGGSIGWAIGTILARGIHLIVPVGLEKLIPSVAKAVSLCGQMRFDYCQGLRVGMVPLSGATVITEIGALKILTGAHCFHVASGGSSGSEGAVTLVAEGEASSVKKAIQLVESIKGEPPLAPRKGICLTCRPASPAQPKDYRTEGLPRRCDFEGKNDKDLPQYLKNR